MAKTSILMKMGLDTSKVKEGLKSASKSVSSFADTAKNKLGGVAKLASGAMVAGFLSASKSAISYSKELMNLSRVANTSFEDFQALAHGAKTVGIESDKLADIFKDTGDKIGDFMQTGGGPMKDFFENIAPAVGVTADQFRNLSGKDALQLYFDSLQKANLSQEEMTFYMEAIASDATMLIPLLDDGGEAWNRYAQEARDAGLVMDTEVAEQLRIAQLEIEKLEIAMTIGAGNSLMGFKLLGGGIKGTVNELANFLGGVGGIFKGTFTFDEEYLRASWEVIFSVFRDGKDRIIAEMDGAIGDALNIPDVVNEVIEFEQAGVEAFKGFYEEGSKGAKIVTEADRKRADEAIRQLEKQRKFERDMGNIREKIIDEQLKQSGMLQTAEEQHRGATENRVRLEKELGDLTSINNKGVIEALGLQPVILEKKLELERAITAEIKTEKELNDEVVAQQETMVENARKNVQLQIEMALASGDVVKARQLQEQLDLEDRILEIMEATNATRPEALDMAKKQNALVQERMEDHNALAIAIAREDDAEIARLDTKIQREEFINDLFNQGLMSKEEAGRLFDQNLEKANRRKQQELEIIRAQADGNDALAKKLQMRIDKQDEAKQLMRDFNLGLEEAVALAGQLASMRAGPDLNMDGVVTRREQKNFDKQEKAKAKRQQDLIRDAERDEREIGGNIPNVSGNRRNTGSVRERAQQAREKRIRGAENREIQRRRNRGEDMENIMEDINERRDARKAKLGGQPPNGGGKIGGNGNKDGDGKDPKKPEDPIKDQNEKLDTQIGLLKDIKTALKC